MRTITLLLLCCVAHPVPAGELFERWPGSKHEWRIVEQTTSADGTRLSVVISVPGGIFPAAVWLQDDKATNVKITLRNIRKAEGVGIQSRTAVPQGKCVVWRGEDLENRETSLKDVQGFQSQARDKNWELSFTGPALELLRRGGRFQFIDAYR